MVTWSFFSWSVSRKYDAEVNTKMHNMSYDFSIYILYLKV